MKTVPRNTVAWDCHLFTKHELFVSPVKAAIFVFVAAAPLKYNLIIGKSNNRNGLPRKKRGSPFLLYPYALILYKSEVRVRNIKDQYKQN